MARALANLPRMGVAPARRVSTAMHLLRPRHQAPSHLDLEQIDPLYFRAAAKSLWVPCGGHGVFGGQVLGQALHAATRTVDGSLGPYEAREWTQVSLHSYFLHRGEIDHSILYRVKRTSDLRSFKSRSVEAVQHGRVIFKMQCQFARRTKAGELHHATPMPADVRPPEECPCMRDELERMIPRAPATLRPLIEQNLVLPVEVRYADGVAPDLLNPSPPVVSPARQRLWMRVRENIDERERLDECCAAYISDQPLLLTALTPHGVQWPGPKVGVFATLDHSMWFHAPIDANDWMLYEMESPHAGGGTGLAFGRLYQRSSGELVVSCAQQGVVRLARPPGER